MVSDSGLTAGERRAVEDFRKRHRTGVLALLFTDIVGSTEIKQRLGDTAGTQLVKRQHDLVRDVLSKFSDAEEISTAGDSFFIVFVKPSDSVRFALRLQNKLDAPVDGPDEPARVRIGIHMGEVFIEESGAGALERDVLGLHVDTAARVMSLAKGGQILLSRSVFDNARTILTGESLSGIERLSWVNHGPYMLKGLSDPVDICEVGERDQAKLRPPTDTDSGKRATVAGAEPVLGWRPALEQVVPGTEWQLERLLGEGGFGEVWLGRHRRTKDQRVFKFCFRADQLRNLKREMTLFRLLKEVLGERADIARLYNVQFEEAPYYLELEHTPGGDLSDWIESRGGFDNVPMEQRLEIVAQIAAALAAAHSVGVLHKDVKPSNTLVEERRDGSVQVRLTDFGIGEVTDRAIIERAGLTATGLTEMISSPTGENSSRSGTRLYMAPELMAGRAPSIQSDLYSLGVLAYQMIAGDLTLPMTTDWERRIDDPLLREDLRGCLGGEPNDRFAGADELARRLRALGPRRKRHNIHRVFKLTATLVLCALVAMAVYSLRMKPRLERERAERQKAEQEVYFGKIGMAAASINDGRYRRARKLLAECLPRFRDFEWGLLYRLANPNQLSTPEHADSILDIAYSPDGSLIAGGCRDGVAVIWDAETGQEIRRLEGHAAMVLKVAFSPDGKRLATSDGNARADEPEGAARVWDVETGELLLEVDKNTSGVLGVAISPDGKQLATSSLDGGARIRDIETGRLIRALQGHGQGIHSIVYGAAGRHLLTASMDRTVQVWNVQTGNRMYGLDEHSDQVFAAAVSPDGKALATGSADKTIRIWNAQTGERSRTIREHTDIICDLAFDSTGKRLASASQDGSTRVWNPDTGEELMRYQGHGAVVRGVAFSPDDKTLATCGFDRTVRFWDLDRPDEPRVLRPPGGDINAVAFAPKSGWVAMGGTGVRTARVWDAQTGRELLALRNAAADRVQNVVFSPDERALITSHGFSGIVIWDSDTGRRIRTMKGHKGPVKALAISADGRRLASGGRDQTVKIWDVNNGHEVRTLRGHEDQITDVAFSPDGRRLASASLDSTVRIWDMETSGSAPTVIPHPISVDTVAFSPNGCLLATGCGDDLARVWDLESGETVFELEGHADDVTDVSFHPAGDRLVTSGYDGTITVWDLENGREVLTLRASPSGIDSLALDPVGRRLAAAGLDGKVRVWEAFPWGESDLPGRSDMKFAERARLYELDRMKDCREAAKAARAFVEQRKATEEADLRKCADNLLAIYEALVRFKAEHNGEMPLWLSDLTPGLIDPKRFLCPRDAPARAGSALADPKLPCSYSYQWSNTVAGFVPGDPPYREWKEEQREVFGDIVPTVRCKHHMGPNLSLTYAGKLYLSPGGWEENLRDPYPLPGPDDAARAQQKASGALLFQEGVFPYPDYRGCEDAYIMRYLSRNNTGACEALEVGSYSRSADDPRKTLIRFGLDAVPSSFPLQRAELRLFGFGERQKDLRNRHTLYAARVLKSWGVGEKQGKHGAEAEKGDVTFDSAHTETAPWEIAGALGITDVADAESSATAGDNWPAWVTFDVTESVREFLKTPERNHGWKISQDPIRGVPATAIEYEAGAYLFKSSEAPQKHLRPVLILIPSERTAVKTATTAGGL